MSIVSADTSTTSTKKIKDIQLGEVIQIGGSKFVALGGGRWMATEPASTCDDGLSVGGSKDFDYTGGEQTFTVCAGRSYKLEVWGAQGGLNGTTGGYGGYSAGVLNTSSSLSLFVNAGGQGQIPGSTPYVGDGGYNGGGQASCSINAAGGGGATHIATVTGELRNLLSYKNTGGDNVSNEILIVAGGGGGTCNGGAVGGNGGGYVGNTSGSNNYRGASGGGSQTAPGANNSCANYCIAGGFGYGGRIGHTVGVSGGGGGWYGGGVGWDNPGGGGSGYIASSNLISSNGITKHMTCYSCATSKAEDTYTQSNTCVNATATADCSKTGNGYARITRLN